MVSPPAFTFRLPRLNVSQFRDREPLPFTERGDGHVLHACSSICGLRAFDDR